MTDTITVVGNIAGEPKQSVTSAGIAMTTFRIASEQRRFDRGTEKWVDEDPNWYNVTAFRALAVHAGSSLAKGNRVIVRGKLRLRKWAEGEKAGVNIGIEADAIGPDLRWGTTTFTQTNMSEPGAEATSWASDSSPEEEASSGPQPIESAQGEYVPDDTPF